MHFTATNMVEYLDAPLERLVLKPYRLNYNSLIELFKSEDLNQVTELEIDVEECREDRLASLLINLPFIRRLRLFHLEKIENQKAIVEGLNQQMAQLTLTKCYNFALSQVLETVRSPRLERLDLTEALLLQDLHLSELAQVAVNLKFLNLSWCNELTNESVGQVIAGCLGLEGLVLNGIKSLTDKAFADYEPLKVFFDEKLYDDIRYTFKKKFKEKYMKSKKSGGKNMSRRID